MNDQIVYLEGIGWCTEIVVYRTTESGISEPYTIYELIKK